MTDYRTEKDTMGEVRVPAHGYWGASTQRAVENFPISGFPFPARFIRVLGLIKGAAAEVNAELGHLDAGIAGMIADAAKRVAAGEFDQQFPIDVFQTGSGTSTNTNANEVIANVANAAAGSDLGSKKPVHPSDHVNFGQSSNDVIPTVIHVAALEGIAKELLPALERLHKSLKAKADEFASIVKPGRTHLMDATPVTLGQEFGGYARQIGLGIERVRGAMPHLGELALGGTAVGTGINTDERFAGMVIAKVAEQTGLTLTEATDHFEAQGAQDACVEMSGALKTVAVSMVKISNDLRWMNSGPRAGLAEIHLPDLQPGSSIMPGKVNPVIPEVAVQVAAQVIGADAAITFAGASGTFELNVTLPLIAINLLGSIELLAAAANAFVDKCVDRIDADEARCRALVESTDIIATALNPVIGYDKVAELINESRRTGKSIREVALAHDVLPADELDKALNVDWMTKGGLGK
jgi:fumarate hydratase class II